MPSSPSTERTALLHLGQTGLFVMLFWAEECGVHLLKGKLVFLAGEDSEGDKMGAVLEIAGARCDTVTHCPRDTHCLLGRLGIFCKT